MLGHLYDIPKQMKADLLFDQSVFVKEAINTVLHEGLIGLVLTSIMILLFLGNLRATTAVLLSIPTLDSGDVRDAEAGQRDHQHDDPRRTGAGVFAGDRQLRDLAREHLPPSGDGRIARDGRAAGGIGSHAGGAGGDAGRVVDFFPVTLLFGVSKFLFSRSGALLLHFAAVSFVVAMTVIPLFCSRFLKAVPHGTRTEANSSSLRRSASTARSTAASTRMLDIYETLVRRALAARL